MTAGRDWGQEEKGMTEDEMAGWHHWLDGRESEWTPGVGDGQGGLACWDSWGRKESDTTERVNWTELMLWLVMTFLCEFCLVVPVYLGIVNLSLESNFGNSHYFLKYFLAPFYHSSSRTLIIHMRKFDVIQQFLEVLFFLYICWNSNTLATSCEELTRWKRLWCWEGLGSGGEGDDRWWDGWMASPTRWTWVWVTPGVGDGHGGLAYCDSWGRRELDKTEWLNWTELM